MLTPAIDRYLELRRALGYKLETSEIMLRSFARHAQTRGETRVTGSSALAWTACGEEGANPSVADRFLTDHGFGGAPGHKPRLTFRPAGVALCYVGRRG